MGQAVVATVTAAKEWARKAAALVAADQAEVGEEAKVAGWAAVAKAAEQVAVVKEEAVKAAASAMVEKVVVVWGRGRRRWRNWRWRRGRRW